MRTTRSLITALLLVSAAACATGTAGVNDSVARLEVQQREDPTSAAVNRSLGIAYYKANRYLEARAALESAAKADPKDGTTALYLGLNAEAMNDLPTARAAYASYIQYGRTSRVRGQLESRLVALSRKELQVAAKSAIAQESSLGTEAGNPRTVAVLPMHFAGSDTNLKALERGFADLLTTDLARSSQLTLVERSHVQALMDEIALQQSGATEVMSNVRTGKLVRAGRVVQGSLTQVGDQSLSVSAAVVDVTTSQISGTANAADQLDAIFNLERKLALDLFTQLGVTLTVAERNAIDQRPTRSLNAFLAYSRGLAAGDAGRFDVASRFFNEATRIDPGFNAALQKGIEAKQAAAGSTVSVQSVESGLRGTSEGAVVQAATQGSNFGSGGLTSTVQTAAGELNPSAPGVATGAGSTTSTNSTPGQKDPVSSGTGTDNPSVTGKVTIVIKRP
jgi:tetratricopeptide (TPR) repeat protein